MNLPQADRLSDAARCSVNEWVNEEQLAWIKANEEKWRVGHLQDKVQQHVNLAQARDLRRKAARARREICFNLLYIILFSLLLPFFASSSMFPYVEKIRQEAVTPYEANSAPNDAFLTYGEILTYDEVWAYLEDVLMPAVFPEESGPQKDAKNTLIGAMQMQQSRADRNDGCEVPPIYEDSIEGCYPSLKQGGEATDRYGSELQFEAIQVGEWPFKEWVYVQNFSSDLNVTAAQDQLRELRDDGWIDLETRRVKVRWNYFNPAVDAYCAAELWMDFLASGGILPLSTFRVLPINTYRYLLLFSGSESSDFFPPRLFEWVLFGIEAIFFFMLLLQTWYLLRRLCRQGCARWAADVWVPIDMLGCCLLLTMFGIRWYTASVVADVNFVPIPSEYSDFYTPAYWTQQAQNLLAIAALFVYVKLIKYMQLSPRVSAITSSLMRARREMMGHLLALAIILIGYSLAMHTAFGHSIYGFSTMLLSLNSMFYMALGDFDFESIVAAAGVTGIVIFTSYMIIFYFLLYNMLIVIIFAAYVRMKETDAESRYRSPNLLALRGVLMRLLMRLQGLLQRLCSPVISAAAKKEQRAAANRREKEEMRRRLQRFVRPAHAPEQALKGCEPVDTTAEAMIAVANARQLGANFEENEDGMQAAFIEVAAFLEDRDLVPPLRMAFKLADDTPAEVVSLHLIGLTPLLASAPLPDDGLQTLVDAIDELLSQTEAEARAELDVRALDLSSGGTFSEWRERMRALDHEMCTLAAGLGRGQQRIVHQLASMATVAGYLNQKSGAGDSGGDSGGRAIAPRTRRSSALRRMSTTKKAGHWGLRRKSSSDAHTLSSTSDKASVDRTEPERSK